MTAEQAHVTAALEAAFLMPSKAKHLLPAPNARRRDPAAPPRFV